MLVSSDIQGNGDVTSTYVLSDGNPEYPVRIIVKTGGGAKARFSVRFQIPVIATMADSSEAVSYFEVVLALNSPYATLQDPADVVDLLGMMYAFLFTSVDGSNNPSASLITKWSFGTSELY
jgi:hypothetical protein